MRIRHIQAGAKGSAFELKMFAVVANADKNSH
jgi:hypothetical protein